MRLLPTVAVLLAVLGLVAAACGGDGSSHEEAWPAEVRQARHSLDDIKEAIDDGDMAAAAAAFDGAQPGLMAVVDLVKPVDQDLAAELEGMVLHMESHFDMGSTPDHMAGVLKDCDRLLKRAGDALVEDGG